MFPLITYSKILVFQRISGNARPNSKNFSSCAQISGSVETGPCILGCVSTSAGNNSQDVLHYMFFHGLQESSAQLLKKLKLSTGLLRPKKVLKCTSI